MGFAGIAGIERRVFFGSGKAEHGIVKNTV